MIASQLVGCGVVVGCGDALVPGPQPLVIGDGAAVTVGADPVQVGAHLDAVHDRRRMQGVVVAVETDVEVPRQPPDQRHPVAGATGSSGDIAAVSAATRSSPHRPTPACAAPRRAATGAATT